MRMKNSLVIILITCLVFLVYSQVNNPDPDAYEIRFSIKVTDSGYWAHTADVPLMVNTKNLTDYYGIVGHECQRMHFKRLTQPGLSPPFLPFYVLRGCNSEETEIIVRLKLNFDELTIISLVFGDHPLIIGQAKYNFYGEYVFPCDSNNFGTCHQGTTKFKFDDDPGKQRFAKGVDCGSFSGFKEGSEYHTHRIVNTTVNSTHGIGMHASTEVTTDILTTGSNDEWGILSNHVHDIPTFDTLESQAIPQYKNIFHCSNPELSPPNNTIFLFKTTSFSTNFTQYTGLNGRFIRDSIVSGLGGTPPLGHRHIFSKTTERVSMPKYLTQMQDGINSMTPTACAAQDEHYHSVGGNTEYSEYGHLPSHVILNPARYANYEKPLVPFNVVYMATQIPPLGFQIVEDMVGKFIRLYSMQGYSVHNQVPHIHKVLNIKTNVDCAHLIWLKENGPTNVSASDHVHQINNFTTEGGMFEPLSYGILFLERIPRVTAEIHRIGIFPVFFQPTFGLWDIIFYIVLPSSGGALVLIVIVLIVLCCYCRAIQKKEPGMKKKPKKSKKSKKGDDVEFDEMDKLLKMEEKNQSYANLKINKSLFEIKYEDIKVLKKIGKGGSMSLIFKCTWENKTVAFKCFKLSDLTGTDDFEDFEKEVSIQLSMNHPNIIRCYGAVLHPPRCGIVLEYCSQDLGAYVEANKKKIPIQTKFKILSGIINGLKFLHKKKLIHRDIKPENVLLDDKSLEPKLIDFGLSKVVERMSTNLKTARIGTSYFIAPEVVFGGEYNEKCDIFSFGMLMFELLTETRCYDSSTYGIEFKIANDENFRPNIAAFVKSYAGKPDHFKLKKAVELMQKCWKHDSSSRPNCEEIGVALKKLMK